MAIITGAKQLQEQIKNFASVKSKMANTHIKISNSMAHMNTVADQADKWADTIQKDADDLLAQMGQYDNGAPEITE